MKKVLCEYCGQKAPKKYWVPVVVKNRKSPLMVFKTCELCGLYVHRVFHKVINAFTSKFIK